MFLTDVYQSMALHMFWMLNSLTLHLMWSIPFNIFRETATWKPACDFRLFPKHFCFFSLGMLFFLLTHNSALHIPSPFLEQMYHRHILLKASAMLTVLRTTSQNPVRSLCWLLCTLLVQCSVTITCRYMQTAGDVTQCKQVYVLLLGATGCIVLPCSPS